MRTFFTRFFSQQFKRSCVPDGPKVGTVSLSPRGDWRMPSDADPQEWLRWATGPNPPGQGLVFDVSNPAPQDEIPVAGTEPG